ncbi:hypothetical protein FNH22_02710 [Fulvivirga sp. M361]|uniref:hypothetical protein n=1 Tax=Fulvivirga sp. M361 TaxID=2594266 RepID=UPI001179C2E9|nr:hypothetical protein [Fulvivirga sp. M361]TRX61708.1 hypothetical protein FNH22_02710 [Fulvivirga sp. M361]
MRTPLIIVLLSVSGVLFGQRFPSELWHDGYVVLIEGDTLKGQVKYDLETDLIQHKFGPQETINTITARSLSFFEIFDGTANRYRQFYVLPYNVRIDYRAPVIFELIYEGEHLTLLSREKVEYQVTSYPYAVSGTYTRLTLVYTYYFLSPNGGIVMHTGKKNDLLWNMKRKSPQMKKFLKENKIKVDRRSDLIKVVSYYNSLFENSSSRVN